MSQQLQGPDCDDAPRDICKTMPERQLKPLFSAADVGESTPKASQPTTHVVLHIYDLVDAEVLRIANGMLNKLGTGIFHVGLEVYGWEWSYGYVDAGRNTTGIFVCAPKVERRGYRQSILLGRTSLSILEVRNLVNDMRQDWLGAHYDPLRHNCGHFCEALAEELQVGPLPKWAVSLAEAGSTVKGGFDGLRKASNLMEAAVFVAAARYSCQPQSIRL